MTYYLEGVSEHKNLIQQIKEGEQPVILFGSASHAKDLMSFWAAKGYPVQIKELWDNVRKGTSWNDLTVTAPHPTTGEMLPVIICSYIFREEMTAQSHSLGYQTLLYSEEFYYGESFTYEEYSQRVNSINLAKTTRWEREHNAEGGIFLPTVAYIITDRCDLRCRDCAHLMQFMSDAHDFDLEQNKIAFQGLLDAVDYIGNVDLVGGEPLLNRELADYLEFLKPMEKIGMISITTNGTLLPDQRTLNLLSDPHFFVQISGYGSLSRRLSELEQLFRENKVFYTVMDMTERKWVSSHRIYGQGLDEQTLTKKFSGCGARVSKIFRQGKLFSCPFASSAQAIHAIPFSEENSAEILLDSPQESRKNLNAFLKRSFMPACNYCEGRSAEDYLVPPAVQSPTVLPYFRYD